jgi:hypothetical protein
LRTVAKLPSFDTFAMHCHVQALQRRLTSAGEEAIVRACAAKICQLLTRVSALSYAADVGVRDLRLCFGPQCDVMATTQLPHSQCLQAICRASRQEQLAFLEESDPERARAMLFALWNGEAETLFPSVL